MCTWRYQILKSKTKKPLKVLSSPGRRGTKFTYVCNFPAQFGNQRVLNFGVMAVRDMKLRSRLPKNIHTSAFLLQNLSSLLESRPLPTFASTKKPFDVICCLYKMKQSHWLLCVARNCDWSRKITPLSNLFLMKWKLTAKAENNCEIYKSERKCWKN